MQRWRTLKWFYWLWCSFCDLIWRVCPSVESLLSNQALFLRGNGPRKPEGGQEKSHSSTERRQASKFRLWRPKAGTEVMRRWIALIRGSACRSEKMNQGDTSAILPPLFHSDTRHVSSRRLHSPAFSQTSCSPHTRASVHVRTSFQTRLLLPSAPESWWFPHRESFIFPVQPRQWPSSLPEGSRTATNLSNQVIKNSISAKVQFDYNIYQHFRKYFIQHSSTQMSRRAALIRGDWEQTHVPQVSKSCCFTQLAKVNPESGQ